MDDCSKTPHTDRFFKNVHARRAEELRKQRAAVLQKQACALGLSVETLLKLGVNLRRSMSAKY